MTISPDTEPEHFSVIYNVTWMDLSCPIRPPALCLFRAESNFSRFLQDSLFLLLLLTWPLLSPRHPHPGQFLRQRALSVVQLQRAQPYVLPLLYTLTRVISHFVVRSLSLTQQRSLRHDFSFRESLQKIPARRYIRTRSTSGQRLGGTRESEEYSVV
jgi:hypothetical protein